MKRPHFDPAWPDLMKALYAHDMQEVWDPTLAPHVFNMYHDELSRYLKHAGPAPLHILDVGCAQGTLALLLAEAGHSVVAMDIRPQSLDYARTRYERGDIRYVAGNLLEYETDERFDLIFANQILEHVVYPVEFLSKLRGWLRDGGRVVATTPNGRYVRSTLPHFSELGDVSAYRDRQFTADGDGHFFAYTKDELRRAFAQAGFATFRVRYYATPWMTGHMKLRYLHGVVPARALRLLDRACLRLPGARRILAFQLWGEGGMH